MTRSLLATLAALACSLARAQGAPAPVITPLAAAAAPAALPPAALTKGSDGGWSVLARLGTYVPVMGELNVYRPGFSVEAGLGRRLASSLWLEVTGYRAWASAGQPFAVTTWLGTGTATASDLDVAGAIGTLRATYASGPAELFVGAGGGFYWIQQYVVVMGSSFSGGFASYDRVWGGHACAGAHLRLTPALHASAEVRYTLVEPYLFGEWQRADGIGLSAGLGYRF